MVSQDSRKAFDVFDSLKIGIRTKEWAQYRNLQAIVFVLLVFMSVMIILIFSSKTPAVARHDDRLVFSGTSERFRFVGGNSQNLLAKYLLGNVDGYSGPEILEESARYNITVLRFYATGSDGYFSNQCIYDSKVSFNRSERDFFAAFDGLVSDAEKRGIYLIPVLVDGYSSFRRAGGPGLQQQNDSEDQVCEVGSAANAEYKRFVEAVVTRYKDRATILAWEIGEEGHRHCASTDNLLSWYRDTSQFIRAIDKTHAISSGEGNFGDLDTDPFQKVHSIGDIDLASVTIFDKDLYGIMNVKDLAGADREDAIGAYTDYWSSVAHIQLFKPVYFGEFGSYNITVQDGREFYIRFLQNAMSSDADGFVVQSWMEGKECPQNVSEMGGTCISPNRTPAISSQIGIIGMNFKAEQTLVKQLSLSRALFFVVIPMWVIVIVAIRTQIGPRGKRRSPIGPQF
jgi:hypothetical protein